MRNIRVLVLRLVVDMIMMLAGYEALCGLCYMFFGAVEDFKIWFELIIMVLAVAVAMDDVRDFADAQSRKRR